MEWAAIFKPKGRKKQTFSLLEKWEVRSNALTDEKSALIIVIFVKKTFFA